MLIASFGAFAQISVNSYGDFQLAEKRKVYKYYGTTLQLEPDQNETGYIGVSGKQFYRVCTKQLYLDGINHTSDAKLKENFRDIENPLEKIMLLKGQKYDFKTQPSDSTGSEKEKEGKSKNEKR